MAVRGLRLVLYLVSLVVALDLSAATFLVNSTADTGDASPGDGACDAGSSICTLRAAIEEANSLAGADAIHFAIGSGQQTIAVGTVAYQVIIEQLTIDGTTQPGYAGVPLIEFDGSASTGAGLQLFADGCVVRGLMLNRFPAGGVMISGSDGNTVEDCAIGTDATFTQNRGNGADGIAIHDGSNNS